MDATRRGLRPAGKPASGELDPPNGALRVDSLTLLACGTAGRSSPSSRIVFCGIRVPGLSSATRGDRGVRKPPVPGSSVPWRSDKSLDTTACEASRVASTAGPPSCIIAVSAGLSNSRHWPAQMGVGPIGPDGGITSLGGTGESGYSGDGGPATEAELKSPVGVAADGAGNVYVADPVGHAVRRIDASETISTFAGAGEGGYGGDGGPAVEALLNRPSGVAADAAGSVFVADTGNHRIRRIEPGGVVSTFAGTGTSGYNGDYQVATSSRLSRPERVAVNGNGKVFVLEGMNPRVRVVVSGSLIQTVAGNGETNTPQTMIDLLLNYRNFGLRAVQVPLSGASPWRPALRTLARSDAARTVSFSRSTGTFSL